MEQAGALIPVLGGTGMTTIVVDIISSRQIEIEGDNRLMPSSVFLAGLGGSCIEFDRATFLAAIAKEFGLVDPLELQFAASSL